MPLSKLKNKLFNSKEIDGNIEYNSAAEKKSSLFRSPSFILIIVILLILNGVGIYWSHEPDTLPERNFSAKLIENVSSMIDQPVNTNIKGSLTTASLIYVTTSLLDKPGGYLSNDVMPPSVFLDNTPNWEFGALTQVRDLSKAMREAFSRSQSQSIEDESLKKAEPNFNFDNNSWIFPATESKYREGIAGLNDYHSHLVDDSQTRAQFYTRADNLEFWLNSVERRLGSLSQRLSASVGQRRLNTDLAGEENASQSTPSPKDQLLKTPWYEIDDVFYEARGTTWALINFLKAVEIDFANVLENKNARVSLRQIIRELEATQKPINSPFIFNGSGFGMFANHSLVMASYISRANAAIIDLRELLSRG